jgi:molybdenum cofactor sulfurtransferase
MVCIDQETGEKGVEPFVTLAKTRRLEGKIYFGVHMRLDPAAVEDSRDGQRRLIRTSDSVFVDEAGPSVGS